MGIARYLFNDWFTAGELDAMDRKLDVQARRGERATQRAQALEARLERLEQDLGRVALLARALAETCIDRGVLPLEIVKQEILRCDLLDGAADGVLDPRFAHPEEVAMVESEPPQGPGDVTPGGESPMHGESR